MNFPLPRIEFLETKKLVGIQMQMSFSEMKTYQLWQGFMPQRKLIASTISEDLFSLSVYPQQMDFSNPDMQLVFDKWAAKEVSEWPAILPENMNRFELESGYYAVFCYRGNNNDWRIFKYIFGNWLPQSGFKLDDRPHFEILGSKYKNNSDDSEEEIWVPIKKEIKQ